jgi:hypothetical protein
MRSVRRLFVVGAAIIALTAIVPSASAASHKTFALTKTCEDNYTCTVQTSSFNAIPPDTQITYLYGADPALAYPTITVRNGSTTGVCDWDQPGPTVLAICTFGTGTGRLSAFHLEVDVSVIGDPTSPTSIWHWDGTYWFGGGD